MDDAWNESALVNNTNGRVEPRNDRARIEPTEICPPSEHHSQFAPNEKFTSSFSQSSRVQSNGNGHFVEDKNFYQCPPTMAEKRETVTHHSRREQQPRNHYNIQPLSYNHNSYDYPEQDNNRPYLSYAEKGHGNHGFEYYHNEPEASSSLEGKRDQRRQRNRFDERPGNDDVLF